MSNGFVLNLCAKPYINSIITDINFESQNTGLSGTLLWMIGTDVCVDDMRGNNNGTLWYGFWDESPLQYSSISEIKYTIDC